MATVHRTLRLGMLGAGGVGAGVLKLLRERENRLAALGVRFELVGVLVRDLVRPRPVPEGTPLTTDPAFLEGCDVVVELMGGVQPALDLVLGGLHAGRPLVTANKALLAERWDVLREPAERGLIHWEGSVMAGTPVVTALASVLRGSRVTRLQASLNATCTHVLRTMEGGVPYEEALLGAQAEGIAEADPTLDVSGLDAAHKLTLLARLVADPGFELASVETRGIDSLDAADVAEAMEAGERVRLVAELLRGESGWQATVGPRRLPAHHPLCSPMADRNALWLEGTGCGELFFAGGGRGPLVTASAVVGDLFAVAAGELGQRPLPRPSENEW